MLEIWKDIKDYEGSYKISNLGRVKSIKFNKEKILKQSLTKNGYYRIELRDFNKGINKFYVHRLVGLVFINNPDNKKEINHIDKIRTNNNANNLEWVTHAENLFYICTSVESDFVEFKKYLSILIPITPTD